MALGGTTYLIDEGKSENPSGVAFVLSKLMNVETVKQFLFKKEGPLYCFPDIEVIGFVHTR